MSPDVETLMRITTKKNQPFFLHEIYPHGKAVWKLLHFQLNARHAEWEQASNKIKACISTKDLIYLKYIRVGLCMSAYN